MKIHIKKKMVDTKFEILAICIAGWLQGKQFGTELSPFGDKNNFRQKLRFGITENDPKTILSCGENHEKPYSDRSGSLFCCQTSHKIIKKSKIHHMTYQKQRNIAKPRKALRSPREIARNAQAKHRTT